MSGGRFSHYLNDLNMVPSPYDQEMQQQDRQELFNVDEQLALFTNAEFLDYDTGASVSLGEPTKIEGENKGTPGKGENVKYLDMLNDLSLPNYRDYNSSMLSVQQSSPYPVPGPSTSTTGIQSLDSQLLPSASVSETQVPPTSPDTSSTSSKRKSSSGAQSVDEMGRIAQEEDRRRRNTAASARFRIKKKEREKNMERTVKDVTTKNASLEARIAQLEMENRWLRSLITEKNGPTDKKNDSAPATEGKAGLSTRS